jgi:hypothetical protein
MSSQDGIPNSQLGGKMNSIPDKVLAGVTFIVLILAVTVAVILTLGHGTNRLIIDLLALSGLLTIIVSGWIAIRIRMSRNKKTS